MKTIPRETVQDIANHLLKKLDQRLSLIETNSKSQQNTLKHLKQDSIQIEKDLKSFEYQYGDNQEFFSIPRSISNSLKGYIKANYGSKERIKTHGTATTDVGTLQNLSNSDLPAHALTERTHRNGGQLLSSLNEKEENPDYEKYGSVNVKGSKTSRVRGLYSDTKDAKENLDKLIRHEKDEDNKYGSVSVTFKETPEKGSKTSRVSGLYSDGKENLDKLRRLGLVTPTEKRHSSRQRNMSGVFSSQGESVVLSHVKNSRSIHNLDKPVLNRSASDMKRK